MENKELKDFALELAKKLAVVAIEYTEENFDSLNINPKVSPFIKVALNIIKAELLKTDGLVSHLHKYVIQ